MEENERPAFRPFANFGPGMRLWLLFSLYFACGGVLQLIGSSQAMAWMSAGPDAGYPVNYTRLAEAIAGIVLFGIPAIVYANVFPPERFRWLRLHVPVKPIMLVLGALLMIAVIPGVDMIYEWGKTLIKDPALKTLQETVEKSSNWMTNMPGIGDLFICLLANALLPAIMEELFFRASMQQLFEAWTKKPHMSVWLSAFLFSMLHFNVAAFPVILLAGLLLGYAFYLTGSLRMTILMHFVFNGTSLVIAYLGQHDAAVANWEPSAMIGLASLATAFVLFGLLFRFGNKA